MKWVNAFSQTDIVVDTFNYFLQAIDRDLAPSSDGVKSICFGNVEIEAWYKSQYPLEYSKSPTLYVCEFCLEYMKKEEIYNRHMVGVLFCMIGIIHLICMQKFSE